MRSLRRFGATLMLVALAPQAGASEAVMCVQAGLAQLGYDAGPSDGAIGRRTTSAAKAMQGDFKLSLPAFGEDTAAEWCDATKSVAASPAAGVLSSKARILLPVDVLVDIANAPEGAGNKYCNRLAGNSDLELEPVMKISGFTSRMNDVADTLPNVRPLERFVGAFGAHSVLALATKDEARKADMVRLLAKWANANALLDTISCVRDNGDLITTGKCTEWRKSDGSDLSGMKDATFVTFLGAGMIRAYYVALADADPIGLAAEHAAIAAWINKFSKRLKRPEDVYFGLNMGWYWPSIINDLATGNADRARQRLARVQDGLISQINSDGSIKDRTTRGDRALWYHFTSINEIVVSMEMMRAAGMVPSEKLEKLLHGAVQLFVSAVADPDNFMDPWARDNTRARYQGKQNWDRIFWFNGDMAGSWIFMYQYRYPGTDLTKELAALVRPTSKIATVDNDIGLGLGCLYNMAMDGRSAAAAKAP
jgi:hypothetical protein